MKKTLLVSILTALCLCLCLIFVSCGGSTEQDTETRPSSTQGSQSTGASTQDSTSSSTQDSTGNSEEDGGNTTDSSEPEHVHSYGEWTTVTEPTCTEAGERKQECSCGDVVTEVVEAKGHTEETIEGKAATCTEKGLTDGKKCTVCGEITVEQEMVVAKGHIEETIVGKEPICTDGLTDGKKCTVCGKITVEQKVIPVQHKYENSYTCSLCGYVSAVESEGLQYKLNEETDTYILTGIGTCTDTDIVIPYICEGKLVTSIGSRAFYSRRNLTSVTIPSSVTSIGSSAFDDCASLTSVTIPSSVTSIGTYVFSHCKSLTSIEIPNGVTSIEGYAFMWCESLTSVTIPNSVTSIDRNAFYGCSNIKEATIPTIAISTIQKQRLEKVVINGGDSINNDAFRKCTSLTSVTIGNSVTSIGEYAFYECTSLTSVTIGNGVTSIGKFAFFDCKSLKEVHINDISAWCGVSFSDNSVNPLCYAKNLYLNGELVTNLVIPEGVTSISKSAFEDCTSLTSVTIPNSVTSIGKSAFYDCESLKEVHISDISAWCGISFDSDSANPLYYAKNLYLNGKLVTNLVIPEGVTSIGGNAFDSCTSLTSITIPEGVTSIGGNAFDSCTSLTSITIPDSVTSIGFCAFYDCKSLTSVTIGNGVTSIGNSAFYNCTNLTSIEIPNSVTSIGNSAFYNCISLTIYCEAGSKPNEWNEYWNKSTCPIVWDCINNEVADDGYVYTVTDGVRYRIKDSVATVVNQPSNIEIVIIPESVTYNGVSCPVTSIGSRAFLGCTGLISITIPDSVTSIGDRAFLDCTSLTSITIPDSVTSIGEYAFHECKNLTIYCEAESSYGWSSNWNSSGCQVVWGCLCEHEWINATCTEPKICEKCGITVGLASGHNYGEWITIEKQTCTKEGKKKQECSNCGDIIYEQINATGHQYSNRICSICGDKAPSEGLEYELSSNGTFYTVVGIGNCTDEDIYIPDMYRNLPVKVIGASAFYNCGTIKSVAMADGIEEIRMQAFAKCAALEEVIIGNGVTSIGRTVFYSCYKLKSVIVPNSVATMGDDVFNMCTAALTIYCEAESKPSGWSSTWNSSNCPVVWGYVADDSGNEGGTSGSTDVKLDIVGSEITKEQWEAMRNTDNFTVKGTSTNGQYENEYIVNSDSAYMKVGPMTMYYEEVGGVPYTIMYVENLGMIGMQTDPIDTTIQGMLLSIEMDADTFDLMTFNSEKGCYVYEFKDATIQGGITDQKRSGTYEFYFVDGIIAAMVLIDDENVEPQIVYLTDVGTTGEVEIPAYTVMG